MSDAPDAEPGPTRDPVTGQYAYDGDFERMCTCGHTLGVHVHGGFECINQDIGDKTPCGCAKFRASKSRRRRDRHCLLKGSPVES